MASKNAAHLLAEEVTRADLAALVALSERQVLRLTNQGVFALGRSRQGRFYRAKYVLGPSVSSYIKHLRDSLARDASEEAYNKSRARRMAAHAEAAELSLQLQRGELHRASDVEFCMTNMLTFFKQRTLAIPARVSRQLIGKRSFREIYDVIMTEIVGCLRELSGYDSAMFAEQTAARLASQGVDLAALEKMDREAEGRNGAEED